MRQIQFIKLLIDYVIKNGTIDMIALTEDPFRTVGEVGELFEDKYNTFMEIRKDIENINENAKELAQRREKKKPFSNEYISKHNKSFNTPKVIDTANKIYEIVVTGEELDNDEKQASLDLAFIKLQEYYRRNK